MGERRLLLAIALTAAAALWRPLGVVARGRWLDERALRELLDGSAR
jgi:hypothetical protein